MNPRTQEAAEKYASADWCKELSRSQKLWLSDAFKAGARHAIELCAGIAADHVFPDGDHASEIAYCIRSLLDDPKGAQKSHD